MSNEKATVEEWQTARKNTKMTQPKVAKLFPEKAVVVVITPALYTILILSSQ